MVKLKQSIQFNAGTVVNDRPTRSTFMNPHLITIAMGKDAVATLVIPQDAIDNNPEIFEDYDNENN